MEAKRLRGHEAEQKAEKKEGESPPPLLPSRLCSNFILFICGRNSPRPESTNEKKQRECEKRDERREKTAERWGKASETK
jgi:hypothetical protein